MPNITISLDEELIKAGRRYAANHHTSMNAMLRNLLEKTVKSQTTDWLAECFELMTRAGGNSKGQRWKREDLYDV
jgi:plasmid stability protein